MSAALSKLEFSFKITAVEAIEQNATVARLRASRSPRRNSMITSVYVPIGLGILLMVVSVLRGPSGEAQFGALLLTGLIAYLVGYFALSLEMLNETKFAYVEVYRLNRGYHDPISVRIGENLIEVVSTRGTGLYPYQLISDVETVQGAVVIWLENEPILLVPANAFASLAEGIALAATIRDRIQDTKTAPN